MFWRRKKKDKGLFSLDSGNQRSSFRVSPSEDAPLDTCFRGKPVRLCNIGAVGVAFTNDGFQVGHCETIQLNLPGEPEPVSATMEVVEIDADGVCHCAFPDLDETSANAIHRYMLKVQIQEIRKTKTA